MRPSAASASKVSPRTRLLQSTRAAALTAFALALALRLIASAEVADETYHQYLVLDAATYHSIAVSGDPQRPFWQPPMYPWMLRAVYSAFGGPDADVMRTIQCIAGAWVAALLALLGGRLSGPRAAWIAGVITALYGPLIAFDLEILPATWGALLITLLMAVLLLRASPEAKLGWVRSAIAGLLLGVGGLLLPTLALPGGLLGLWLWRSHGLSRAAVFALCAVLPIIPVHSRNAQFNEGTIPVSWNGGINFYIGNSASYPETQAIRPGNAWNRLISLPHCEGKVRTFGAESTFFYRKGLSLLKDDPLKFVSNLARKSAATVSGVEIGRNRDVYAARGESTVLNVLLGRAGLPFALLFALAAGGVSASWRERVVPAVPTLIAVGVALGSIAFFPTARYRVPALPALILLAACGVGLMKRRDGIVAAIAFAVTFIPHGIPRIEPAETYYEIAVRLDSEQRGAAAADAFFRRAAKLAPENSDIPMSHGLSLLKRQRGEAARQQFERAVELNPDCDTAWQGLGLFWRGERNLERARTSLEKAVEVNPCNRRALAILGEVLLSQGYYNGAREVLEKAREAYPRGGDATVDGAWKLYRERSGDTRP